MGAESVVTEGSYSSLLRSIPNGADGSMVICLFLAALFPPMACLRAYLARFLGAIRAPLGA